MRVRIHAVGRDVGGFDDWPAIRLAKETGLPLLGTSDSHLVRQFGTTWSLIEAEPTVTAVLAAIRKGQGQVVSQPLTLRQMAAVVIELVIGWQRDRARRWLSFPLFSREMSQ